MGCAGRGKGQHPASAGLSGAQPPSSYSLKFHQPSEQKLFVLGIAPSLFKVILPKVFSF